MQSRDLAGPPDGPVRVPDAVARLAGGADLVPVWQNSLGGLTFRAEGEAPRYVKWCPSGVSEIDLEAEAERMTWAARYGAIVPRVLELGDDGEGSWLVTAALPAESAVADRWRARPREAARTIGEGLRRLHETLPVEDCPFTWSVEQRIAHAPDPAAARESLGPAPEVDPVVCQGDACAPNTLIGADGSFAAHVDLGALGVADRWADLAVAAWSTEWNYGPGYEDLVYEGYGIAADPSRIDYYRRIWDLT